MCGCGSNSGSSSTGYRSYRHTHEANFNANFNPTLTLALAGETYPEPSACRLLSTQDLCEAETSVQCTWSSDQNICYDQLDLISGDVSVANLMIPATLWNWAGGGEVDCVTNPYECVKPATEEVGVGRQSLVSTLAM